MIKLIDEKEYNIIKEWGVPKNYTFLPFEIMPKRGFISYIKDVPVFACWMYITDDGLLGFIAYPIYNPDSDNIARGLAFDELFKKFEEIKIEENVKCFFTTTNNASLLGRLINYGFTKCGLDIVHLFK